MFHRINIVVQHSTETCIQKDRQVETFIIEGVHHTGNQFRTRVTQNLLIGIRNLIVAVHILYLDIARSEVRAVGGEFRHLGKIGFRVLPDPYFPVVIVDIHRLADKPFATDIVVLAIIQFNDFFLVRRQHQISCPLEVFRIDVHRVDRNFYTFIACLAHIRKHVRETGNNRQLAFQQQIMRVLHIQVDRTVDTSSQNSEIDTQVPLVRRFPSQQAVRHRVRSIPDRSGRTVIERVADQ